MSNLELILGTRNYSSWSLRPWILLRHLGLDFDERVVHFDTPEFASVVSAVSPTRRVPVLRHGDLHIWESVAICEYASEQADGRGWPAEMLARAHARAVASEMHAGFSTLRAICPMNARARGRRVAMTDALRRDVMRVDAMWSDCRARFGAGGPWLYGAYSTADAMYAPVVLRFLTYGLPLSLASREYFEAALADPELQSWIRMSQEEGVTIPHEEVGLT